MPFVLLALLPVAVASSPSVGEIHRRVSPALVAESHRAEGPGHVRAVLRLCDLYAQARGHDRYARSPTLQGDAAQIRRRLADVADRLESQLERAGIARPEPAVISRPPEGRREPKNGRNPIGRHLPHAWHAPDRPEGRGASLQSRPALPRGRVGRPASAKAAEPFEVPQAAGNGRTLAASEQYFSEGKPPSGPARQRSAGAGGGAVPDAGWWLVDLIRRTIAPEFWDTAGGPGTIRYFSFRRALVIRGTTEVHDQTRRLLQALRGQ